MSNKLTFSNSSIESIEGVDYLKLNEESHYKTGFAGGILFVKSKYKIIKLLKNPFIKIILWFLYLKYEKKIQEVSIPKEYQDELRGCAEAIKISYKYLLLINLIYFTKSEAVPALPFSILTDLYFWGTILMSQRCWQSSRYGI